MLFDKVLLPNFMAASLGGRFFSGLGCSVCCSCYDEFSAMDVLEASDPEIWLSRPPPAAVACVVLVFYRATI